MKKTMITKLINGKPLLPLNFDYKYVSVERPTLITNQLILERQVNIPRNDRTVLCFSKVENGGELYYSVVRVVKVGVDNLVGGFKVIKRFVDTVEIMVDTSEYKLLLLSQRLKKVDKNFGIVVQ